MEFLKTVKEVVFLGPSGSYSEMAKDVFCEKYDIHVNEIPLSTITEAIEYVNNNENVIGVIPVENSIEGAVREAIDCLIKLNNNKLQYLAEYILPIRHCLLSKNKDANSIKSLISHPQAIAQCLNFIHTKLSKNLNIERATSTANAAKMLSKLDDSYAAIGSSKTAELYNLNILQENINDDASNQTRFVLLGKYNTPQTLNDKTSLAFSTVNESGALLKVLKIFQDYNINLSYIDSRPSKIKFGEYTFLVDFDGHYNDEIIAKALKEIEEKSSYFRLVGSYEKLNTPE